MSERPDYVESALYWFIVVTTVALCIGSLALAEQAHTTREWLFVIAMLVAVVVQLFGLSYRITDWRAYQLLKRDAEYYRALRQTLKDGHNLVFYAVGYKGGNTGAEDLDECARVLRHEQYLAERERMLVEAP